MRAQHLGVDEEADHALGFQARAVGIRHADADLGLARCNSACQPASRTMNRLACCAWARPLRGAERGGDLHAEARSTECALVGRGRLQVKHGQFVTELGLPVLQLAFGFAVGQPCRCQLP